jgi:hypothetical protein
VGQLPEAGKFVELRGRPWLVEEIKGDQNNLQMSENCDPVKALF